MTDIPAQLEQELQRIGVSPKRGEHAQVTWPKPAKRGVGESCPIANPEEI
jgi:hypothetical protein